MNIKDNRSYENVEKHRLGDVVSYDDDLEKVYMVIQKENEKYGFLDLRTFKVLSLEYESVFDMWVDNQDDVVLNSDLIINN